MLVEALAIELMGDNIRVNCIKPSPISRRVGETLKQLTEDKGGN
jgi:NAD(P)-dependent dehydrogenase (short-subunit alcohol dehydrogenase family)